MSSNFVKAIDLYTVPIWIYQYEQFEEDKEFLYNYFDRADIWLDKETHNGLTSTTANLHKTPDLLKFTKFVYSSLEDTMIKCGYQKDIGITSMWATKHARGGFHHQHTHKNSFLSAVFYLRDDTGYANGTTFYNPLSSLYQIRPAVDFNVEEIFKSKVTTSFAQGALIVFPSWLSHSTAPYRGDKRIVIAVNAMPIGKTNMDHFDRYNYSDPAIMDLKEYSPLTVL